MAALCGVLLLNALSDNTPVASVRGGALTASVDVCTPALEAMVPRLVQPTRSPTMALQSLGMQMPIGRARAGGVLMLRSTSSGCTRSTWPRSRFRLSPDAGQCGAPPPDADRPSLRAVVTG